MGANGRVWVDAPAAGPAATALVAAALLGSEGLGAADAEALVAQLSAVYAANAAP